MSTRNSTEIRAADGELFERRDAGLLDGVAFRAPMQLELRSAGEGSKMPGLGGYTAMFNSLSEPLGFFEDFREKIAKGAFAKTITESDVRALFNHDPSNVLGRTRPESERNTLTLTEDDAGLEFEVAELPDNSTGRDVAEMVERGDVDGCSFGFRTVRDAWEYDTDEASDNDVEAIRILLEVRLFDVGPVTYPAYPETTAEVRSKITGLRARRDASADTRSIAFRKHRLRLIELGGVELGDVPEL